MKFVVPGNRVTRAAPFIVAAILVAWMSPGLAHATSPEEAMQILKKNCVSCHNEKKRKGDLSMVSREALLTGGDTGAAVVPGSPEESLLIESLTAGADPHMPPKKQLAAEVIQDLTQWVKDGAAWDAEAFSRGRTATPVAQLEPLPGSYRPVLALALSPNGDRLAVGAGHELVIYDTTDAKLPILARGSAHPEPVESIAWSADGKRLATGAYRRVVLWDPEMLEAEATVAVGLTGRISAIRFIDSSTLVIADGQVAEEGTIRLVDATCGSIVESWVAHTDSIFDLAVTSDGGRLASAGGDKLVKIWDLQTRTEIARLEGHQSQVLTVRFDATGERLLTGGADQQLKVWSVKTKDRIMTLGKHSAAINGAVWIEAGAAVLAITDAGGVVRYTDLKEHAGVEGSSSGTERNLESADTSLYCMSATTAGDRIYAGSHDGTIFVWDKDGKLTNKLETNASAVTVSLTR